MKIAYCSDLHIEMGLLEIYNTENAEVLILAGDIIVADSLLDRSDRSYALGREFIANRSDRFHSFFLQVCEEFPHVIYICGNHELYRSDYPEVLPHIRDKLSYLSNLHILEKEKFILNDITFLAGTMWTDFNRNNPVAMQQIARRMNDFQIIKNSAKRKPEDLWDPCWTPEDAYEDHQKFLQFAQEELNKEENKKVIMVTHHCPSYECVPEKYQGDTMMNPGYVSDLSNFILDNPKIKNWVAGHSHVVKDFMIGSTRILINCRGYYGREELAEIFELKYFEV